MQTEKEKIREQILNWAKQLNNVSISSNAEWKIYKSESCPDMVFINFDKTLKMMAQAKACLVCEASTYILNEVCLSRTQGELLYHLEEAISFLEGYNSHSDFNHLRILREFNQGPRAACMLLPWKSAKHYLNEFKLTEIKT